MDDELEDKVFYQTYISQMKILSRFFAMGVSSPVNTTLAYFWKLFRLYIFRPEVILIGLIFCIFLLYLQAVEVWRRGLGERITNSFGFVGDGIGANWRRFSSTGRGGKTRLQYQHMLNSNDAQSWDVRRDVSAVYAIQGRRPKMEDRFVIDENLNSTGISFFAIFDGHGGEFAADFAKEFLVQNIYNKITETSNILRGVVTNKNSLSLKQNTDSDDTDCGGGGVGSDDYKENKKKLDNKSISVKRKKSFRKSYSQDTDDCAEIGNCNRETDVFLNKIILLPKSSDFLTSNANTVNVKPKTLEAKCYIENGKVNYGKLVTDEVLATDYKLVAAAKKTTNVAGTTALIAIVDGTKLYVANVGDSRGVMCDVKGAAIPLSFDHKPQQVREKKRIEEAGGYIAFKGVWRVAGILATSRALGDYPLKDKKLVIADPDILTFDLAYHRPMFIILASDGLWDTFLNEEAVAFIKERLHEPHFGAKSITLESYYRGSVDNITVLIIVFKDGKYQIGRATSGGGGGGSASTT